MMEPIKHPDPQWYKNIWSPSIKDMSWVENTKKETDFIIETLELSGSERILDLACGFGRHSLELAKRGFSVVGVDITSDYINEARSRADSDNLDARFICADLRDSDFRNEFDVVLNLADGAIGYLENDRENLKIFKLIGRSLKKGGKHFMNICNAEHAEMHFPKRNWEIGEKELSLPEFHWIKETRRMLYGGWQIKFGEIARKPDSIGFHSSIRLYSVSEIKSIFKEIGMTVLKTYGGFDRKIKASHREMQLLVYSRKV